MFKFILAVTLTVSSLSQASRIVAYGDEWVFSDASYFGYGTSGFTSGNDGAQFAVNVAGWLTEGHTNKNILISSTSFGLNGSILNSTLTGAGYGVAYNPYSLSVADLSIYDAVFVSVNSGLSSSTLAQYVTAGGNVFLEAGTGTTCEDCAWDPFLNQFGLDLGPGYNGVGSPYTAAGMSIPLTGTHPIMAGIDHLQYGNGNTLYDINALDPRSEIVASYHGTGIIGVYDGNTSTQAVPEPGSLALLGAGLAGMGFIFRRRK